MTTTHNNNTVGYPHSDDPLELRITTLIAQGRKLANQLFDTHAWRSVTKDEVVPAAWQIREQLTLVDEELELCLSELEKRAI